MKETPNIDLLREATSVLNEALRIHDLCMELLDTLTVTMLWIKDYAEKNHIPLPNKSTTYASLINKAQSLMQEIGTDSPPFLQHRKLSDGFSQPKKPDKDFTVPCIARDIRY